MPHPPDRMQAHPPLLFGDPPPVNSRFQMAAVAPSGQGVVLVMSDGSGNLANITDIAARSEVQVISLGGQPTGGSFTLSVPGTTPLQVTDPIPYNATAQQVFNALVKLPFLSPDGVHPATTPPAPFLVDDVDGGFTTAGAGWLSLPNPAYFRGNCHGSSSAGAAATWSFPTQAGSVRLSTIWTGGPNRATVVTWTVRDGANVVGTGSFNEQPPPTSDVSVEGSGFATLGTFPSTGNPMTLTLTNTSGDGYLLADAVYVESLGPVQALTVDGSGPYRLQFINRLRDMVIPLLQGDGTNLVLPAAKVISPGGPGYAETAQGGSWTQATGAGYAGTYRYAGGYGLTASWTVTGLVAGVYTASVDWIAGGNNARQQLFEVYDDTTLIFSTRLDMSIPPVGDVDLGYTFQHLGDFTINSGTIRVRTTDNGAGGYAVADSMRVTVPQGSTGKVPRDNPIHAAHQVTGNANVPTVRINGGAAIPLHDRFWGQSRVWSPFIFYSLPAGTTVTAQDSVTFTAADSYATTTAGTMPALANFLLENRVGKSLLPDFDFTRPRTMRVGYNWARPAFNQLILVYANMAKHAVDGWWNSPPTDENGYLVGMDGLTIRLLLAAADGDGFAPACFAPSGLYTLMWDGPEQMALTDVTGNPNSYRLVSDHRTGGANNLRVYDVQAPAGVYSPTITALLINPNGDGSHYVPQMRNLRVYPPGVDATNPPLFHPYLTQIVGGGSHCVRWMDTQFTNNSLCTQFSEINNTQRVQSQQLTNHRIPVSAVGPHAPSGFLDGGSAQILFTTPQPHQLQTGLYADVTLNGTMNLSDGTVVPSGSVFSNILEVVSPTQFAMRLAMYYGDGSGFKTFTAEVAGTQAVAGTAAYTVTSSMPIQDMVEWCNQNHSDCWFNIPGCAPDQFVTDMITYVLQHLRRGLRLYLEYSNECWNFAFTQNFLQGYIGRSYGNNRTGAQQYAFRAAQVHAIAADLFVKAGRTVGKNGDLVRVFATQGANPGVTQDIVAYCAAQGLPIDAMASAPYVHNDAAPMVASGEPNFGQTSDSWNVEQLMDLQELHAEYGGWEHWIDFHRGVLDAHGYTADKTDIVAYEGGPERGIPEGGNFANIPSCTSRQFAWQRHPRLGRVMLRLFEKWEAAGCTLFNIFELAGGFGIFAWGNHQSYKQINGPGDGSRGGFDNRTNYEALDKVEAVTGWAADTWGHLVPNRNLPDVPSNGGYRKPLHWLPARPVPPVRLFGQTLRR